MGLSLSGTKMASVSGLRGIMEDIATTTAASSGDGWLNLSIGNPAPIPEVIGTWRRLTEATLGTSFATASCQYGPSRGAFALVDAIVDYFNEQYGWGITAENVAVGPGSQMMCFVAAALFAGPGTDGSSQIVLPAVPDYTGYQALCMYPAGVAGVAATTELLGDRRFRYTLDLAALQRQANMGMLLVSSPSNPTGRCIDQQELDALVCIAEQRGVPLFIDNAYGAPFPQIAETQVLPPWHGNVVNLFTISKAGMPGERIGFAIGSAEYINPMVSFVANSALHAPQLAQLVLARALRTGELDRITASVIQPYYRNKRLYAEKVLSNVLPESIDWRLHASLGGMFCWLWVNDPWFDDAELYRALKKRRVFVVPGRPFFVEPPDADGPGAHARQCFRISLSADESVISEGVERIAETLEEMRCAH